MAKQIAVLIGSGSKTSFSHLTVRHLQKWHLQAFN